MPPKKKPDADAALGKSLLHSMILQRRFEEKTAEAYALGKIGGFCHLYIGQEAVVVGMQISATGNLGRDSAKKLYATCINLGSGPEKGRQLGRCVTPGSETKITADPNVDYTVHPARYATDISGYWDNRYKFHVTVDDFEPKPMPMSAAREASWSSTISRLPISSWMGISGCASRKARRARACSSISSMSTA